MSNLIFRKKCLKVGKKKVVMEIHILIITTYYIQFNLKSKAQYNNKKYNINLMRKLTTKALTKKDLHKRITFIEAQILN